MGWGFKVGLGRPPRLPTVGGGGGEGVGIGQTPLLILRDTVNGQAVRILLECFLAVFKCYYRSGTVNSNMVNSKFHLIQSFF